MPRIKCSSIEEVIWKKPGNAEKHNYVHLYRLQLSANAEHLGRAIRLLSTDEVARGNRYLHEKDGVRFRLTRAVLRLILSRYTETPPGDIEFVIGDNKKPVVRGADIHYNVSHAGDWAVIGISDMPLGVDVEMEDREYSYQTVLDICFQGEEINRIQSATDSLSTFYQLWTRKESLVKATAKGMDDDFKLIPSTDGDHTVSPAIIGSTQDWNVVSIPLASQHVASVAYNPSVDVMAFYEAAELTRQL